VPIGNHGYDRKVHNAALKELSDRTLEHRVLLRSTLVIVGFADRHRCSDRSCAAHYCARSRRRHVARETDDGNLVTSVTAAVSPVEAAPAHTVVGPVAAIRFDITSPVLVSGRNATQRAASYEQGVRDMYGAASLSRRTYQAPHNLSGVGRADNVTAINGKEVAIEAKYTDDWSKSPFSQNSTLPWAAAERAKMINQARNYSDVFDEFVYHTDSKELADSYNGVLPESGIDNFSS
jgi:hypothetical protein